MCYNTSMIANPFSLANEVLVEPILVISIDAIKNTNPHYISVRDKTRLFGLGNILSVIQEAKNIGLRGLYIDDYDHSGLDSYWEPWFVGTPEEVMMLSLKYSDTAVINQEKMNNSLKGAAVMIKRYAARRVDYCYMVSRIARKEDILIKNKDGIVLVDATHLIKSRPRS